MILTGHTQSDLFWCSKWESNARNIVYNLLGRNVPIEYARIVGTKRQGHNRSILIRLFLRWQCGKLARFPRLPKCLVIAFENFTRPPHVTLRRLTQTTWKCPSMSISMPADYVFMKNSIDSRLLIELGPCQLNIGCVRINTGTQNRLLNGAYKTAIYKKHNCMQSIQA